MRIKTRNHSESGVIIYSYEEIKSICLVDSDGSEYHIEDATNGGLEILKVGHSLLEDSINTTPSADNGIVIK